MFPGRLGPYQVLRPLGSGGMGTVYLASAPDRGLVALKVIHPHLLVRPGFLERFLREAEVGTRVVHENVVRTFGVGLEGEHLRYLVMEYVEGRTVRDLLQELGRLPEELCRHIGCEVAKALEAIHAAGVVHRDLKPDNILITADHVVKVMDLGVARLADETLSQAGHFAGSLLYAAPEQFSTSEPGPAADLYALGLTLYELAVGEHPFPGAQAADIVERQLRETPPPVTDVHADLSPFFEQVVQRLLLKAPGRRFESATAVREVLELGERSRWWLRRAKGGRPRPRRRPRLPRETAVHGRERELERLRELYDAAKGGRGQVVLVEGEPGIGKTRLVDELVARLEEEGERFHFLTGACPSGGAVTAAGAFCTAFREHFGARGLDDALARHLWRTPLLRPAFAALLRGEEPPPLAVRLTDESLRTVFVHVARELAAERPTIVLVDDLQRAPEEGRALFAALAQGLATDRVLLAATMRPGVPEAWTAELARLDHVTRLPLGRLGPKDLAKLLVEAFGSEPLAKELSFRIASASDGNPFFVFEIIRTLRERGRLAPRADGSWARTGVISDLEVPTSLLDLVKARLSRLDAAEQELLDVAVCLGFEFDPLLVAAALGQPRIATLRGLAGLEQEHRLVRAAGRTFVFDHHHLREAVYGRLPGALREEYHGAIGEALLRRHGPDPQGVAAFDACDHLLRGSHPDRALACLPAALDHLEKAYRHEAVAELAQRALALQGLAPPQRLELLWSRARALGAAGRHEEELAAWESALALAESAGDPRARAKCCQGLAAHYGNTSQYREAGRYAAQALQLAREAGDRGAEAAAGTYLHRVAWALGDLDAAERHFAATRPLFAEIDEPEMEATLLTNQGGLLAQLGRHDEAFSLHERALELAAAGGDLVGEAIAQGNLGNLAVDRGRLAEALRRYERSLELFRQVGDRRGQSNALVNLGSVHTELGDPERGRRLARKGRKIAEEIAYGYACACAELQLALVEAQEGRRGEALRLCEELLERLRVMPLPDLIASALLHQAQVEGLTEEQRPRLERARALADESGLPTEGVLARALLARLPGPDPATAIAALEGHGNRVRFQDRIEIRYHLWKATGDPWHLERAHVVLMQLCEHAPEDCREAMIRKTPHFREIEGARH